MSEVILGAQAVADRLGVSARTLTTWKRKGILVPAIMYPTGRYKYTEAQIIEFEQRAREGGTIS